MPRGLPLVPPAPLDAGSADNWLLEPGVTFLNHGSFGAVPRVVFDAQTEWRRRIEAAPVELLGRRWGALLEEAKAAAGAFLGMRPADFGFVNNASEAANTVLRSLTFRRGDELRTTTHVYNAIRQAMRHAGERWGATYREIDVPLPVRSPAQLAEVVIDGLSDRTRLLVIDHVTSPTALIFPVEQIVAACAARGIDVLIDGAHAPGMLPLDISRIGCAYYAGNLHKWCFAPKGAGFLWVRPDRQDGIHPLVISHDYGTGFAREFGWQGTRDISAWLTIPAGLRFAEAIGWERIRAHNEAMARWAHAMLCDRLGVEPISPTDGSMLGSMAAVRVPGRLATMSESDAMVLQQRLYSEFRVEAPLFQRCGAWVFRVSCQVYNVPDDYERIGDVIAELA